MQVIDDPLDWREFEPEDRKKHLGPKGFDKWRLNYLKNENLRRGKIEQAWDLRKKAGALKYKSYIL